MIVCPQCVLDGNAILPVSGRTTVEYLSSEDPDTGGRGSRVQHEWRTDPVTNERVHVIQWTARCVRCGSLISVRQKASQVDGVWQVEVAQ